MRRQDEEVGVRAGDVGKGCYDILRRSMMVILLRVAALAMAVGDADGQMATSAQGRARPSGRKYSVLSKSTAGKVGI